MKGLVRLSLLLALGVLPACGPAKSTREPCPAGKVCFERGNAAEPQTLDPSRSSAAWEQHIIDDLFTGLVQPAADGESVPGMATSWDVSKDGLTWTFHLRDAKWSDGVPVTAEDFVFGLQRLFDPKTASDAASIYYFVKNGEAVAEGKAPVSAVGASAPDPHTFVLQLEHPAPYLLEMATGAAMYPIPKHAVDKWGDHWSDPGHYVSNGAYTLVSWKLGDKVVLQKDPLYWNAGKVCIDRVDYYPTTDPAAAERRVRAGELDMNADITSNRIAFLRKPDQIPAYVHTHDWIGLTYMTFNLDFAPFKDKRVREALSMAVDRDFIAEKLLRGGQKPAYTFVPAVANYTPPPPPYWAKWTFEQRQVEARRLLAEAGYGPKHPLKIEDLHRNSADPMLVQPAVQADWAAIGVQTQLLPTEVQITYQQEDIHNFQIAEGGWIGSNDASTFLFLLNSASAANNYGNYKNPVFDTLLKKADDEPDAKVRAGYLQQAEATMLNDAPIIPLYFLINKNLVTPRLTGFVDNNIDDHSTQYMCFKK